MVSRLKLRCIIVFIILLTTGSVIHFAQHESVEATAGMFDDVQHPIVRFHVIAHSNAPTDQYYKLKVRDSIMHDFLVPFSQQRFQSVHEAAAYLQSQTSTIQRIVQEQLAQEGVPYQVQVQLGVQQYEARLLAGTIVPEGEYVALRVILGEGQGENFWCIIFPTICFVPEEIHIGLDEAQQLQAQRTAERRQEEQAGVQNVQFRWRVWERVSQALFGEDDDDTTPDSLAARP